MQDLLNHPFVVSDYSAVGAGKLVRKVTRMRPPNEEATRAAIAKANDVMEAVMAITKAAKGKQVAGTGQLLHEKATEAGWTGPKPLPLQDSGAAAPPAHGSASAAGSHQVVAAFVSRGQPVRDRAVSVLATALAAAASDLHPLDVALDLEAALAAQYGGGTTGTAATGVKAEAAGAAAGAKQGPGSGPQGAGLVGEAYLGKLQWLCDVLGAGGSERAVPEVARLLLEGRVSGAEVVAYEEGTAAAAAAATMEQ